MESNPINDAASAAPTYQQVIDAWNAQADEHNQWSELGEDEKVEWAVACAKTTPPAVVEPTELSPDFTDTARAALLWHHQGGSSPVGQPIRFPLGMGQNERLNEHQLREAKRWERLHPVNPSVLPSWPEPLAPVMTDVVGINARLHFRRGWRAAEFAHGIGIKKGEGNGN